MGITKDDKAATVVFGTLLIMLVAIIATATLVVLVSSAMRMNADREQQLADQQSENLTITSINPIGNNISKDYWAGFTFTIYNRDIKDASITAMSIDDKSLSNYLFVDNHGNYTTDDKGNPKLYDLSKPVWVGPGQTITEPINVPAGQSIKLHVGAISWTEELYDNNTSNYSKTPNILYPNMYCSGWYDITGNYTGNNTWHYNTTYEIYNNNMSIATSNNTTDYPCNISYTMFPNNELYNVNSTDDLFRETNTLKFDLHSDRGNLFTKVFAPPIPVAVAQPLWDNIYVLDASSSTAPNGYIQKYEWNIINETGNFTGNGVKFEFLTTAGSHYKADLKVTDNFGMTSDLNDTTGAIPFN